MKVGRADHPESAWTLLVVQIHIPDLKPFGLPLDGRRPRCVTGPVQIGSQMLPPGPRGRSGRPTPESRDLLPQRLVQGVHD